MYFLPYLCSVFTRYLNVFKYFPYMDKYMSVILCFFQKTYKMHFLGTWNASGWFWINWIKSLTTLCSALVHSALEKFSGIYLKGKHNWQYWYVKSWLVKGLLSCHIFYTVNQHRSLSSVQHWLLRCDIILWFISCCHNAFHFALFQ